MSNAIVRIRIGVVVCCLQSIYFHRVISIPFPDSFQSWMPSTNCSFNQYVLASTYMYFKYGSCRGDFNKEEGKIKRKSPHRYFDID